MSAAATKNSKQQISLVTGAARGLGKAVCQLLANKGHSVILGCRSQPAGLKAIEEILKKNPSLNDSSLTVVEIDVTKPDTILEAAANIESKFGFLDTLTNNAGIAFEEDVQKVDLKNARQIFDVNFFGVIEVTNAMLPLLKKSDKARIVNVGSILGSLAEHTDENNAFIRSTKTMTYNASKAALNMYTVDLANKLKAEAKAQGKKTYCRVNCCHPGWCQSDLGNILGPPPSSLEFGAQQIVDTLGSGAKGPTGGYFHNKTQLRW